MASPRVLLVVAPHVYATALAVSLSLAGRYEVVVLDVMQGEPLPDSAFDAVVTNLPFTTALAPVVIELPESAADDIVVNAGDLRVPVPSGADTVVDAVTALLDRYAVRGERDPRSRSPLR